MYTYSAKKFQLTCVKLIGVTVLLLSPCNFARYTMTTLPKLCCCSGPGCCCAWRFSGLTRTILDSMIKAPGYPWSPEGESNRKIAYDPSGNARRRASSAFEKRVGGFSVESKVQGTASNPTGPPCKETSGFSKWQGEPADKMATKKVYNCLLLSHRLPKLLIDY